MRHVGSMGELGDRTIRAGSPSAVPASSGFGSESEVTFGSAVCNFKSRIS